MKFSHIGNPEILFGPEGVGGGGTSPAPASGAPAGGGGGETSSAAPSSAPSGPSPSSASPTPTTPGAEGAPSSPVVTPPAPGAIPDNAFEFGGLESPEIDDLEGMLEQPTTPPAAAPAAAAPAAQPPAPTAPPAAPAAPAAASPAAAAPAPGPQEPTASLPSPAEPANLAAAMEQNAAALIEHMAQNEFKLTDAEIEALDSDATAAIPKILSRVYLRSQMSMLKQLERIVPAMLQKHTTVSARNAKNEATFYSRWPGISQEQHGDLVKRLAVTYRQMNPQAPLEQMVEELGPIVMMAAKIPPGAMPAPNGAAGAPASARPLSPPSPFKPAIASTPAIPAAGAPENPWMGLAGDQDEE